MPREPEIETVLVCDDVRREQNGKDILIGVYGGDIAIPTLPSPQNFVFWLLLKAQEPGAFLLTLQALLAKTLIAEVKINLEIGTKAGADFSSETFSLYTPRFPLVIEKPGDLVIQARWGKQGEFRSILQKPIVLARPAPPDRRKIPAAAKNRLPTRPGLTYKRR